MKTGENAAHFFPEFFSGMRCSKFRHQNRGKCCPIFSKNIFAPSFSYFDAPISVIKAGENAAQFLPKLFFRHAIFKISSSKQGEMLPNFFQEYFCSFFFVLRHSNFRHQNRGKCCPIFAKNFFSGMRCSKLRHQNRGKCCPFFSKNIFAPSFSYFDAPISVIKAGENAAQFLPKLFFSHLIFKISSSEQGEMLPNFFQEYFCSSGILQLVFDDRHQNRGKCCPIFAKIIFQPFDFQNFVIKTGGNAAQFFPRIFFSHSICKFPSSEQTEMLPNFIQEYYCILIVHLSSTRGKCCPFFSKNPFSALRCSQFWSLNGGNAAHFSQKYFRSGTHSCEDRRVIFASVFFGFLLNTGENAARFSGKQFQAVDQTEFRATVKGEMLST